MAEDHPAQRVEVEVDWTSDLELAQGRVNVAKGTNGQAAPLNPALEREKRIARAVLAKL